MSSSPITIEQARAAVLAAVHPLEAESLDLTQALGRVLAQDIDAVGDVPPFASSAMDGYAIRASGADGSNGLMVVGESRAGLPWAGELKDGDTVRISTGAAVPDSADTVVRQEEIEERGAESIVLVTAARPGENIRPAGEVVSAGERVLARGTRLGPAELAAAITAGAGEVMVARRPRAAVLSTGDELREPGAPLGPGEIHNSNGAMLAGLATRAGAEAVSAGRLPDELAATERGLEAALEAADIVIVAGGVSVGPHDHVKPALARLGVEERFWRVALQPGKPTWFGTRDGTLVFGLPGNPVSAAVTFALFVWPAIAALQGALPERPPATTAELAEPVRRSNDREQAIRVRLEQRDSRLVAIPNGPQGSHVITSLVGADALALIPVGDGTLPPGSTVALEPLPR
jgi:molybdopterin molybdotransferase